jgi:hypothetical protein
VFYLIEMYYREAKQTGLGRLVDTKAAPAVQLSGMIIRHLNQDDINVCVTTEVSEEVFMLFFQERGEEFGH